MKLNHQGRQLNSPYQSLTGRHDPQDAPDAEEYSGMVCLKCGSNHISFRRTANPEDAGYACDDCGSWEVE